MFKLIRRSVSGNKTRFALTALAILMGVSFVVGTLIYTDTTSKAFDEIFTQAFEGLDVQVSGESEFTFGQPTTFDETVADEIAAVPGVARAIPNLQRIGIQYITEDEQGEPTAYAPGPAPNIGGYFPAELGNEFQGLRILEGGAPPLEDDQVLVDNATAAALEIAVGDTVAIQSPIAVPEPFEVVGIVKFGDLDSLGGATFALFTLDTIQRLGGAAEEVDGVSVFADDGVTADTLVPAIQAVLPSGLEAISAQDAAEEASAQVAEGLGFFTTFLIIFGAVAVIVGAFLIFNTFRIVVSQRTRELALLRAMGASKRQIRRLVIGEAAVTGVAASLLGIAAGVALAGILQAGLSATGFEFPSTSLQIRPRTIIVALVVGVGVTLGASYLPARRAARIAPVEAMRDVGPPLRRDLRRRLTGGAIVTGLGLVAVFAGLGGFDVLLPELLWLGIGAIAMFVGVTVLAPAFARPVTRVLGAPFRRLFPASGKLAGENSRRSPRRTSTTAGAIMIGIALVSLASVFFASVNATVDELIDNGINADLFVQGEQGGFAPPPNFPDEVADVISADPEVTDLSTLRQSPVLLNGNETLGVGLDEDFTDFIAFDELEGTTALGRDQIAVDRGDADASGWGLGSDVTVTFPSGSEEVFKVGAIYSAEGITGPAFSNDVMRELAPEVGLAQVYVKLADGSDVDAAKARIQEAVSATPTVQVLTLEDLRTSAEDQLAQLLTIITALLGMAIIISLFGVTNTMTLSIFERTREIGLLRAVGMTRGQIRGMILSEASIISMFGAVLGVVLGIFFGWAIINALGDEGFNSFAVPWTSLLVWVVLLGILGVIFALWPARRAARLNVLEAIQYE